MIAGAGYPVETHRVTTADGYVLTLHRIPHGRSANGSEPGGRPVALLQHGILCSSADWVMGEPGKSLGKGFFHSLYDDNFLLRGSHELTILIKFCGLRSTT